MNLSQKQVNLLRFFHSSNVHNVIFYIFFSEISIWLLKEYCFPCNVSQSEAGKHLSALDGSDMKFRVNRGVFSGFARNMGV